MKKLSEHGGRGCITAEHLRLSLSVSLLLSYCYEDTMTTASHKESVCLDLWLQRVGSLWQLGEGVVVDTRVAAGSSGLQTSS